VKEQVESGPTGKGFLLSDCGRATNERDGTERRTKSRKRGRGRLYERERVQHKGGRPQRSQHSPRRSPGRGQKTPGIFWGILLDEMESKNRQHLQTSSNY